MTVASIYVIEVPDVVGSAIEQAARRYGIEPEGLIAEAIRSMPEFQAAFAASLAALTAAASSQSHEKIL